MNVQVFNVSQCSLCLDTNLPFGYALDGMTYCFDCHSKMIKCAECKIPLTHAEFEDHVIPMRGRVCSFCRVKCQLCRNQFCAEDYVQSSTRERMCVKCDKDHQAVIKIIADLTPEDMMALGDDTQGEMINFSLMLQDVEREMEEEGIVLGVYTDAQREAINNSGVMSYDEFCEMIHML
jgi:hypothetical protein